MRSASRCSSERITVQMPQRQTKMPSPPWSGRRLSIVRCAFGALLTISGAAARRPQRIKRIAVMKSM
jgi:hypothetical protein